MSANSGENGDGETDEREKYDPPLAPGHSAEQIPAPPGFPRAHQYHSRVILESGRRRRGRLRRGPRLSFCPVFVGCTQRRLVGFQASGPGLHLWRDVTYIPWVAPRQDRPPAASSKSQCNHAAGIARIAWGRGYGLGVTAGDYDNDGRTDLFVTRLTSYSLHRNRGDGTFEDVTISAGLAGRRDNPTSAAFADLDNDGDLDLYVCHYMLWDSAHPRLCQNEKGEYF